MAESNRATRRRAAKAVEKGAPPLVDVTLADVQTVLNENPVFRQAVVNAALQRQLGEVRTKLAVYEHLENLPRPAEPVGELGAYEDQLPHPVG